MLRLDDWDGTLYLDGRKLITLDPKEVLDIYDAAEAYLKARDWIRGD